jgi:hypothetical protein
LYDLSTGQVIGGGGDLDMDMNKGAGEAGLHMATPVLRQFWDSSNYVGTFLSAPYGRNIAVTDYYELSNSFDIDSVTGYYSESEDIITKFLMIDFDTGEWIFTEQEISGTDACLWTRDGSRLFSLDAGVSLDTFDVSGTDISQSKPIETIGAPIAIRTYSSDIMSVVTDINTVEFYDMNTLRKLCTVNGFADSISDVSYNCQNGIAVISSRIGCVVFDVLNDKAVTGEIHFPPIGFPILSVQGMITNSGNEIMFTFMDYIYEKADEAGVIYEYVFSSWPLLTGQQLLAATENYLID